MCAMTIDVHSPSGQDPEAEKRRSLRIPLRVVRVDASDHRGVEIFFGYASNISVTGLFIQTPSPRERGTKFRISFVLPNATKDKVTCEGEVIWTKNFAGKGSTPGMGLRFSDLNAQALDAIERFVSEAG
jgi:uncharacterized protein (TIGR02266 family)